jgi:hypothetical protein
VEACDAYLVAFSHSATDGADAGEKELFSSWALFIVIMLLIAALFTSYLLQLKKIEAVHETVVSIFAGTLPRILRNLLYLTATRHGGGLDHTGLSWHNDSRQSQLRLSVLLQPSTSSHHSGFRV